MGLYEMMWVKLLKIVKCYRIQRLFHAIKKEKKVSFMCTNMESYHILLSFLKNKFILFIYFWLCWVFVAVHGLSLVVVGRDYSSLWCAGFSLLWLLLLLSTGSRRAGFSSCGTWAQ